MSALLREARAVLASADCLHDGPAVQAAYDRLAAQLAREYQDKNALFLCVMIGGLAPTVELTRRLRFPFELDYLHATRYRGQTSGGGLVWKAHPSQALKDRHVLVIDDILDEGHTLLAIQQALREQAPASLRTVVLADKRHGRRASGADAEFIGLEVEDRYVFGCGMDYKGYFRQLPEIWAVKGA